MIRKYNLYQVDSFTTEKFQGNPAGVVPNATGLSEQEMQKIALELNNSETAFVFPSDSAEYDYHVRFFTPTTEVPLCGHATVAAHYVLARANNWENQTIIQRTGAGDLPVEIIKTSDNWEILMTQGDISFEEIPEKYQGKILEALGVNQNEQDKKSPIQIASTGHSKIIVGVNILSCLFELNPGMKKLSELSKQIGSNGFYVFTFDAGDSQEQDILVHGRMFAPAIGIEEDPVTGMANGALGAYLIQNNLIEHNNKEVRFSAKQGNNQRSGYVNVLVKIEENKPVKVRVGGNAIVVFQTEIEL